MKRQTNTLQVLVVCLCGVAANASGSNLLSNGSFEGGTYIGPNGDQVANNWSLLPTNSVAQSNFNILSTVNSATFQGPEDGNSYAAFMSPATDGSQDCFVESFSTLVGQQYNVSFWVAITAAPASNFAFIPQWDWADADQTNLTNSFYTNPTNTGPVNYRQFTFTETATRTTSNLMFHGTDSSGAILLDNVQVTLAGAPEPAPLWLIGGGFVLCGLSLRIRKHISSPKKTR